MKVRQEAHTEEIGLREGLREAGLDGQRLPMAFMRTGSVGTGGRSRQAQEEGGGGEREREAKRATGKRGRGREKGDYTRVAEVGGLTKAFTMRAIILHMGASSCEAGPNATGLPVCAMSWTVTWKKGVFSLQILYVKSK